MKSENNDKNEKNEAMNQEQMTAAILAIDYVLLSKSLKPGSPHDHVLIESMDTDSLQEARAKLFDLVDGDPGHKPSWA